MHSAFRYICFAVGLVALGLGVVGIFVPMWPTTPFILLAAACFVRSSRRLHRWLIEHPRLGCYVRDYLSGKGMPLRAKRVALTTMWVTTQLSWLAAMLHLGVRPGTVGYALLLIGVAIGVHYHIGHRIPTRTSECGAAASSPHPLEESAG